MSLSRPITFKLYSFIPLKLYVNSKDPTHGREKASFFNFSADNL